ncbi:MULTISPECIES: heat-inducible transcriptional repressor HrcA [unclassified Breznakia]|uniref:heat-inducible transcriptional repressor HrcA n=1 Tax=unclassified Breznakia TaxID=2623764 RepID=UPI0024750AD2|nr:MULTISPECIES: heat-inducible transcriptional repressor HrcA [unclassified Breznakia]MDH6367441.1 heat-inducible transcriptional repressor [Breznakia sp. PH1-1]MDH6404586.1 heat-inducible transcriptional repressor [Breznakia sp. PF1-11]MDH6412295.1 heat-inducible transcriptional repressor [Breznakia sp. PFB1-11]MDH6414608.1 heat-inducible transcriptional repressor [Breznakia sp. PFB1-14]MDH6416979.1 heat-inducible transcriptional repressor [Breznakia sp. PFB1-4]
MQLTDRQLLIFKTIVDEFTKTAEPVGSKNLMNLLNIKVSSATLRNEMAALEEFGLLEKTHTSSGRVPSSKGYRFYVEHLMEKELDSNVENALSEVFHERHYSVEEIVKRSCDILSQMTNLTSVVLGPETSSQNLQHIQIFPINERSAVCVFITDQGHTENKMFHFDENVSLNDIQTCCNILNDHLAGTPINELSCKLEEIRPLLSSQVVRHEVLFQAFVSAFVKFASDNVYTSGASNMLYQPEFADIEKLRELMKFLEDSSVWRQLGSSNEDISIRIGNDDNQVIPFENVSVVSSTIRINDEEEGKLMVVGPTRMPYNKVVALMEYMAKAIGDLYRNDR